MKNYEKEVNQAVTAIKEQFKDPLLVTEWTSYELNIILDIITDNLPSDLKKSLGTINDGIIERERRAFDAIIFKKLNDHIKINL
jgi:hypothetical protein